jgi:5-hydroxyisourate hydrolase
MISTHILDTGLGLAAANVAITLETKQGNDWVKVGSGVTNTDGRLSFDIPKVAGDYRLNFALEDYFKGRESFFLNTPVAFRISNTDRKYHVPLLLNAYGYSTYRGT